MTDLLLATGALAALVAAGLAALAAVTLVPFVVTLQVAEARGFAPARWGTAALAGSALGLGAFLLLLRAGRPLAAAALGLLPVLVAPVLVRLLPRGTAIGGRAGRHS